MKDAQGVETPVGSKVALTMRASNISEFRFGTLVEVCEETKQFKIDEDGKVSHWIQWYYHNIQMRKYCKVLNLD